MASLDLALLPSVAFFRTIRGGAPVRAILLATLLAAGLRAQPAAELAAQSQFQGGLVVEAGCRDASFLLSAGEIPNALVHGLVSETSRLAQIRDAVRESGHYGRLSATLWQRDALPYADAMVNLLVAGPGASLDQAEVDRVLAPRGVAWLWRDGARVPYRKPVPPDTDEWSHSRYDATGNAVSKDQRVGPPRSLQWEAWPRWNHGTKTSCLVAAQGRIFYILDDAHFAASSQTWSLLARDAHNGILLWRHELAGWEGARGGKKVGPAQVHRRLVAVGDRVYATLGLAAPVTVLDAATGTPLRVLEQTAKVAEFLVAGEILVAMIEPDEAAARRGEAGPARLVAVDPVNGQQLWEHESASILPLTLATDGEQVVYHDGTAIHSLNLHSGSPRWTSAPTGQRIAHRDSANPDQPGAEAATILLAPQFAPTMVLYGDVVAFAGGRQINVFAKADGKELWRGDYAPSNYSVPVDLFGFQGALWGPDAGMNLWRPLDDDLSYNAYDPLTGETKASLKGKYGFRFQHHRCHQMKVAGDTVIGARAGIEFLDTESSAVAAHHWLRGSCFYGIMPANGLLYVPPHNCACYIRAKLSGFMALRSSLPTTVPNPPAEERILHGPAYGKVAAEQGEERPDDWPTFRHDPARSGRARTRVGADLLLGWRRELGTELTSPVVAGGQAYVVAPDTHRLHALATDSGEPLWQYDLDARADSPPTVHQGLVLLGCRDGTVHALRASDGALAWRFRAAPAERLIVSRGQLESTWPVHGSVLVLGDTAYFTAGKSSYLDGGIRLYGLEVASGRVVLDKLLSTLGADGSQLLDEQGVDGYLSDILASDGTRLFLRNNVLDRQGERQAEPIPHLHGPDGFLSFDTTSRLVWTYAPVFTSPHQGAFYDLRLSRALFPSGRLLVEDADTIYGFGQNHYQKMKVDPGGQWALFAAAKKSDVPLDLTAKEYRTLALKGERSVRFRWSQGLPIHVWAMVKTEDALFVAGPQGGGSATPAAVAGKAPGMLLAVSPTDGKILATMSLPSPPAWDGLAAAGERLYLTLRNGDVLCLWSAASGRPGIPLSPMAWLPKLPELVMAEEPGLVGRWRLDEGVGPVARDCSGRGHHATVSGAWAEGTFGVCQVASAGPTVVIPDATHLQFGNDDFALALWVKIDGHDVRLVGKEAFPENWWTVNVLGTGQGELVLGEGRGAGLSLRAKTKGTLPTDAWCHLAVVADRKAGQVSWYLDGTLDSQHPIPATMTKGLNAAGHDIAIPSAHKPFRGLVDDIRIYRQALSPERIRAIHDEEAPRRTSTDFRLRE